MGLITMIEEGGLSLKLNSSSSSSSSSSTKLSTDKLNEGVLLLLLLNKSGLGVLNGGCCILEWRIGLVMIFLFD